MIFGYFYNDTRFFQEKMSSFMRGTVFVQEGVNLVRKQAIPKFYNYGETQRYVSYHNAEKTPIQAVTEKLDGSLIQVMEIGGELVAKSKGSFTSNQAIMANEILSNREDIRNFIKNELYFDNNSMIHFELIGSKNRIVVGYDVEAELRYIGTVDSMCNIHFRKDVPIPSVKHYQFSVKGLIKRQETETVGEGYVVQYKDGMIEKFKTEHYKKRHNLVFRSLVPNILLEMVINNKLDDLNEIKLEDEDVEFINNAKVKVVNFLNNALKIIEKIQEEAKHLSQKELAEKYAKTTPFFKIASYKYRFGQDENWVYEKLVLHFKKYHCNKLSNALKFLNGE